MKTPAYSELTPMSRAEVLERDREQDERRRKWQADHAKTRAKARAVALSLEPKPPTQQELDEMERERQERRSEFLAAQEARQAEAMKQIMAEKNALNGRARPA
jgi:hypothetical protein